MIDLGGTTTLTRQLYDEITRCKDRIMGCSSHKEATPYLNRLQFLSNCLTRPARNVASSLYSMLNEYCKPAKVCQEVKAENLNKNNCCRVQ